MSTSLRGRIIKLEAARLRDTCPCGRSAVADTIALCMACATDGHAPSCCLWCRGPLPKIPLSVVRAAVG